MKSLLTCSAKILMVLAISGLAVVPAHYAKKCHGKTCHVKTQHVKEITRVKWRINTLEKQVRALQGTAVQPVKPAVQKPVLVEAVKKCPHHPAVFLQHYGNLVVTGPYTSKPSYSSGDELLVNSPSINEDVSLLLRRQTEQNLIKQIVTPHFTYPRLVLSGAVTGRLRYHHPFYGKNSTDINLSTAELDALAEITPLINGFMAITYDDAVNPSISNRRVNNANLRLDKGFIVIGDFNKSSIYGSVGQMYVPFGRYASHMITDPLTVAMGKTKTRAMLLGYAPPKATAPYGSIYIFKGDAKKGSSQTRAEYGVDLGFNATNQDIKGGLGIGLISSIADANGMQNNGSTGAFTGFDDAGEMLAKRVGGGDIHVNIGYGPFNVAAEYLQALKSFKQEDLPFKDHGAKPKAFNIEGAIAFYTMGHPSSFAFGYSMTREAIMMNLPKHRYVATYAVTVLDNVIAKLEYAHDKNYGKGDYTEFPTIAGGYGEDDLGRSNDTVTAQVSAYF